MSKARSAQASIESVAPDFVTCESVTSKDGTRIGYRCMGQGPGLVLLHGAMQSSASFTGLGAALSDAFTVCIPDRRGRGLSGPPGERYGLAREVEDLEALLAATGARDVFGLSSGALILLQAALTVPAIDRIALFEPPLEIDGAPSPRRWVPRYEKALAAGKLAAAMATAIKGTGDRELFTRVPAFVLEPLLAIGLRRERLRGPGDAPAVAALIPTVHFDMMLVAEMAGRLDDFRALRAPTLLLGGTRSAAFLAPALDALEGVLPDCRRVELAGLGHLAADNVGAPARVADALRHHFS